MTSGTLVTGQFFTQASFNLFLSWSIVHSCDDTYPFRIICNTHENGHAHVYFLFIHAIPIDAPLTF